jgi:hypothetical protein
MAWLADRRRDPMPINTQPYQPSPKEWSVGLRIVLFEVCSAFLRAVRAYFVIFVRSEAGNIVWRSLLSAIDARTMSSSLRAAASGSANGLSEMNFIGFQINHLAVLISPILL